MPSPLVLQEDVLSGSDPSYTGDFSGTPGRPRSPTQREKDGCSIQGQEVRDQVVIQRS